MIEHLLLDVLIAYILDLAFGDPYWLPHPVRFIGWLIKRTESLLRRVKSEILAGIGLLAVTVTVTAMLVYLILKLAGCIHPAVFHTLNIYFIYSSFAGRCLGDEALKVYWVLKQGDIHESRKSLAMLVGRDTDSLNEKEIIRGVVETTAENTVDGVISPLFYAIIGSIFGIGAPLVYAFKAISTLDSMVGYMNNKYMYFGRASAKTDDAANYIPARLSGVLIPLGAMLSSLNSAKSFRIMLRDRRNHKSPNCAYPESAFAGALGIRIGGTNIYFGKKVEKPTIGDADKEIDHEDIPKAVKLMYVSSALALILGLVCAIVIIRLIGGNNG